MKYVAVGRVLPERTYVSFGPVNWNDGTNTIVASADHAQLSVALDLPDVNDVASAAITADHMAGLAVSSLGFSLGSGYSVEITQIIDAANVPHVIGVRAEDLMYDPHMPVFNRALRQASEDVFFRLAIRDYVRALVDVTDCATYCYRAIESIKSAFALKTGGGGWSEMHAALGTEKIIIDAKVKKFSDPIRHGNWVSAPVIDRATRNGMLKTCRDVLERYLNHVRPVGA